MRTADVAIVGAGPAGIAAALSSAMSGASVVLIDEQPRIGGRLRWTLSTLDKLPGEFGGMRGFQIGDAAARRLKSSNVTVESGSVAWGLFSDRLLTVASDDRAFQLQCEAVIIASGSTDRVHPFNGWDLPGVMTSTAFLKAVNLHCVLPGQKVAVIGSGTDAEDVVASAVHAGGKIVARCDSPSIVAADGDQCVTVAVVNGQRIDCDVIVLALGRQPDPELALQILCDIGYSELNGCHVPLRNGTLETSIAGVFAVGDCAGICSVTEAWAEGNLAGFAASRSEGVVDALGELEAVRTIARTGELKSLSLSTNNT